MQQTSPFRNLATQQKRLPKGEQTETLTQFDEDEEEQRHQINEEEDEEEDTVIEPEVITYHVGSNDRSLPQEVRRAIADLRAQFQSFDPFDPSVTVANPPTTIHNLNPNGPLADWAVSMSANKYVEIPATRRVTYRLYLHRNIRGSTLGQPVVMQDSGFIDAQNQFAVAGVFDGHGQNGWAAAHLAGDAVHREIIDHITASGQFDNTEVFRRIFLNGDSYLRQSNNLYKTSGSTGAICLVTKTADATSNEVVIHGAQVGDTRVVIVVSSQQQQKRRILAIADHNAQNASEVKRMRKVLARNGRVNGRLAVTRAMGDFDFKDGMTEPVLAEPEVISVTATKGSAIVIVATDGLWDFVSNEDACDKCLQIRASGGSARDCLAELRSLISSNELQEKKTDNFCIHVMYV
jgi:serine/threonine protein phosphatase PrpC